MKRILAIILCFIMILPLFCACNKTEDDNISVVCTLFPFYDWAREVTRNVDGVKLTLLVDDGSDAHSYQPSFDDVISIKEAELVIRIGGYGDGFVDEAIGAEDVCDLRLSEAEGVTVRHMSSESHEHTGECEDHAHGSEDEHIWLSVKNAICSVNAIANELSKIDPENSDKYEENARAYEKKLRELDFQYENAVGSAQKKQMVFADRFPFVYMTEDYGLEYAAAFSGCTTESDASFEMVFDLAKRIDEWGLSYVCVTESSDGEIAKTVIGLTKNKNAEIVSFDSMQSVSMARIERGATYISVMEDNLGALRKVLG